MRVLADRYELLERIGCGGMADVFRAHDRTLDRPIAVKVMRPAFADVAEFVERFHREAEALGAIDHPNIVRVLDYGAGPDGPFIAMELVTGGTLRDLMRARGRLDQSTASRTAAEIAAGLEAAHVRGVLHRDLKPENILLDADGRPKIADFGIARLAAATTITRTGELLGTPQYLAPEQMSGDVVDERADIYALGVILYEMLTGAQPTGGTTPSEIVSRRLRGEPRPPSRLVALAPALNAIVVHALARDPERRIRRAADLRAKLLLITAPAPAPPPRQRVVRSRLPSVVPLNAAIPAAAAFITHTAASGARHLAGFRLSLPKIMVPAPPPPPGIAWRLPSVTPLVGWLDSFGSRENTRTVARRVAPVAAAVALLAAFIGGTLAFAGARPAAPAPVTVATATVAPAAAVLASTQTPTALPEPTAEPTVEPTPAPTSAPIVGATAPDPAGTIVSFYRLISGHDYASASDLWSSRMQASYPPQTNIWGRFDRTRSIVTRSISLASMNQGSAVVAVDLLETMSDGTVRHWVGTWSLVRSGSGWLLDQPGLRPA